MKKFSLKKFYEEVRAELSKVNWPTRSDTIGTSIVVFVVVGMITFYLGIVDFVVSRIASVLIG